MTESNTSKEPATESPRIYSAWFGFAQRELHPGRTIRIRIRWGRVATAFLALCLIAWMGKSWGLYLFFKKARNFEDVSFMDMVVFPMNRGNVRVQQGDYQIEQAKNALEREDYNRAFRILREGVARSPENVEGRMLLIQLYSGWRPDLAIDLLEDGIDKGIRDADFLRLTSAMLLREKEDQRLLDLSKTLMEEDLPKEINQVVLASRMQSAMQMGKFDIAKELFLETDLENTMDGLLLGTHMYNKTGRPGDAIEVLLSGLKIVPRENATPLYNQLIRIYKDNGMFSEAREFALKLMINNPMKWQPRIQLIDVLSASNMRERRDKEINSVLREYREEEPAMIALAQLSADYGNTEAAARLYEVALENGYNLSLFSLTLAEAFVQAGQNEEAINLCNQLINEDPAWMQNVQGSFNAIRSLAYFGFEDSELGDLYLKSFIESRQTNANQLYQAAKRFRAFEMEEQALRVLQESYNRDSKNEAVLATMIEVEMSLGAFFTLDQHIQDLFNLRRPDYKLIESIHKRLQSDRFLYTRNRDQLLEGLAGMIAEQELMQGWDIWKKNPL